MNRQKQAIIRITPFSIRSGVGTFCFLPLFSVEDVWNACNSVKFEAPEESWNLDAVGKKGLIQCIDNHAHT